MIYITYKDDSTIKNVWDVPNNNVEELYIDFMYKASNYFNINIDKHWLNIGDWENNHQHLSFDEYNIKVKGWNKFKRMWNIDKFISEKLGGRKERYKSINRYVK